LEHGLQGEGPTDSDAHEGRRWKKIYWVPFDLCVELSNTFEVWMESNGRHTYLKNQLPFKLRAMACFRQLRLGGPVHQHYEGYGLQTTRFRYYFLDWRWVIKGDCIKMQTTKAEIVHVENSFHRVGCPGCLDSIDCVHIPWEEVHLYNTGTMQKKEEAPQLWCLKCWPLIPQMCCM
jgi:hypothetical protein